MLLCGGNKFFSIGLDLPALLKLDRPAMHHFLEDFNDLCLALFTAAFPTACALAGHAVAGGNILALTCNYRYAISGKKIGLNELKLGVPVPYLADMILRHTIGNQSQYGRRNRSKVQKKSSVGKRPVSGLLVQRSGPTDTTRSGTKILRGIRAAGTWSAR